MDRLLRFSVVVFLWGLAGVALGTTPVAVDGTVPPGDAGYSSAVVQVQTLQTQFGDNSDSAPDGNSGGSELDNLSVADDTTHLWIALGGNMEINGNKVAIMIDVDNSAVTGATTLPADGYGTFNGDQLPLGVELILTPNAGGGSSNQSLYLNAYCYDSSGASIYTNYLGTIGPNAGNPTTGTITNTILGTSYTFPMALNNANTAGVAGGTGTHTTPDPATVSTGLEIGIPRALLEQLKGGTLAAGDQVGIYTGIGGSGSPIYWSNQFLPALNFVPPVNNLGNAPNLSGQSYVAYTLTEPVVVLPTTIDWCNLQWPPTDSITFGNPTSNIYGQIYVAGVTDSGGQGAGIVAQLGWGDSATSPVAWTNWVAATYNTDAGNNDEYVANFTPTASGTFGYTYRYSRNGGPYVYGDLDGIGNGFQQNQIGILTVDAGTPTTIDWCNLQYPSTVNIQVGNPTPTIYGRVYVAGVTNGVGQGAGIEAEIGWGDSATSPVLWTNWVSAAYGSDTDGDANDEYQGTFTPSSAGTYGYVYRFRVNSGAWAYGDLDGLGNGFQQGQIGIATVTTGPPTTIGWCNLQWPPSISTEAGIPTGGIYGQVWVDGVTNAAGQGAGIVAELGWGDPAVDPTTWTNWVTASYNTDAGNNDEYVATITTSTGGTLGYMYRYSINSGPVTYGDLDGPSDGTNHGTLGQLTVNPPAAVNLWQLY